MDEVLALLSNEPDSQGPWLHRLGNLALERRDFGTADDFYLRALDIHRRTDDSVMLAAAYGQLAIVSRERGDLDTSTELFTQCLEIDEERGSQLGVARTLGHLGLNAEMQGNVDGSAQYFARCREIRESEGDAQGLAVVHNRLGDLAQIRGDHDTALHHYKDSLRIAEKLGLQSQVAAVSHQLGLLALSVGDAADARRQFLRSYDISRSIQDWDEMARAAQHLGLISEDDSELAEAQRYYELSLQVWKNNGNTDKEVLIRYLRARILARSKDFTDAELELQQAWSAGQVGCDPVVLAAVESALGQVVAELGRHDDATKWHLRSMKHRAAAGVTDLNADLAALENKLGVESSGNDTGFLHDPSHEAPYDAEFTDESEQFIVALAQLNVADTLWNAGNATEAMTPIANAVERLSVLALKHDTARSLLATAMMTQGTILAEGAADFVQGLTMTERAVSMFRELASDNSTSARADLQLGLHNLGVRLTEVGRTAEASQTRSEALEMARDLEGGAPGAFRGRIASAAVNYSAALAASGSLEQALLISAEAVSIRQQLLGVDETSIRDLARALHNRAGIESLSGDADEGRRTLYRARELYRRIALRDPAHTLALTECEELLRSGGSFIAELAPIQSALPDENEIVKETREVAIHDLDEHVLRRRALALLRIGTKALEEQDPDTARYSLSESAETFDAISGSYPYFDLLRLAEAQYSLADAWALEGAHGQTILHYQHALEVLDSMGIPTSEPLLDNAALPRWCSKDVEVVRMQASHQATCMKLATAYDAWGYIDEAITVRERAISAARSSVFVPEASADLIQAFIGALGLQAVDLTTVKRLDEAEVILREAEEMSTSLLGRPLSSDQEIVTVTMLVAVLRNLCHVLDPSEESVVVSQRVIDWSRQLVDLAGPNARFELVKSLAGHAYLYNSRNDDAAESTRVAQESVDMAREIDDASVEAKNALGIALGPYAAAVARLGDTETALSLCDETVATWEQLIGITGDIEYLLRWIGAMKDRVTALRAAGHEPSEIIQSLELVRDRLAAADDARLIWEQYVFATALKAELRALGRIAAARAAAEQAESFKASMEAIVAERESE